MIWDYDRLPSNIQQEIVKMISDDNFTKANEDSIEIQPRKTVYTVIIKRLLDIIVSSVALLLFFPINLIICVVTIFDVGFPVLFGQERIGKNNNIFKLYKFRNMTNQTDENGVLLPADERVTKWGSFVRKTSLDELLNFWSIFKGDMSLIGPRPLPVVYKGRFNNFHE